MPDRTMKGVYPILSAPINEKGQLVFEDLEKQVEWCIEKGVHPYKIMFVKVTLGALGRIVSQSDPRDGRRFSV